MSYEEVTMHKDRRITVQPDSDPMNPRRECDNAGTMLCWHGRYTLGDENEYSDPQTATMEVCGLSDLPDNLAKALDAAPIAVLPLYLYDHSGITMSTTPFSCPWDSGQVGFIYITYADLAKTLDVKDVSKDWTPDAEQLEQALAILKSEVSTYDDYLTGNVWGFKIESRVEGTDEWEETDSCWGFFGNSEYCLNAAKEKIDG